MARPPRIELGSQASEAYVISIGPRAHVDVTAIMIIAHGILNCKRYDQAYGLDCPEIDHDDEEWIKKAFK